MSASPSPGPQAEDSKEAVIQHRRRGSSVSEHAKKVSNMMGNWGKGISKGIAVGMTKTKKFAIEKVVKVEPTKETDEMMQSLQTLTEIRQSIDNLQENDIISKLYQQQERLAAQSLQLSETLMSLESIHNDSDNESENHVSMQTEQQSEHKEDLFSQFLENVMGRKLFKLHAMTNEYLIKMEKELINPIDIYKSKELKKAERLLKEYETLKRDYDFAAHKFHKKEEKAAAKAAKKQKQKEKAQQEKAGGKVSNTEQKMKQKLELLEEQRHKLVDCIADLQCKQQINLLNCFDKFWRSYLIFAERQDQIIKLQDHEEEQYQHKKQLSSLHDVDAKTAVDEAKQNNAPDTESTEHVQQDEQKPSMDNNAATQQQLDDDDNDDDDDKEEAHKKEIDDQTIFDEEEEDSHLMASLPDFRASKSLRVARLNSGNQPLSKELRYKNPLKLGSGAFATVYKANDLLNNEAEVAIKKIAIGDGDNVLYLSSTKDEAENELKILRSLKGHTNITSLVDDYYEETVYNDLYLNLVMEYIPNTLISQTEFYADSGDTIPHDLIKLYSFQLCRAVNYMHIKKIAHRDIKPENLLINIKTHELKVCDFGISIKMKTRYHSWRGGHDDDSDDSDVSHEDDDDDMKQEALKFENDIKDELDEQAGKLQSYVCSRHYRAPELILQCAYYDCKIDIWSIGCVMSEMYLGTLLFYGEKNEDEHLEDIVRKLGTPSENDINEMNADYVRKHELLQKDELGESWDMIFCAVMDMPANGIELISKTLVYAPKRRLNALQCLTSAYFAELKDDANQEKYKHLNLFHWNDLEMKYAKANGIRL